MILKRNNNDDEIKFDDDIEENKSINIKLILIIIGSIFLLGISVFIIYKIVNNNKKVTIDDTSYYLYLMGDESVTLYLGDNYVEQGYYGKDNHGNNLTNEVAITNNVNINSVGEYQIYYTLGNITKERNVKIVEKPVGATYIHLMGDLTIYLNSGTEYVEPGYEVIDSVDGGSLKDKVKITDNININKAGIYKRTYTVVNSSGITSTKQRTIIVMDSEISLTLDNENYTNQDININIYVNDPYFDYIILPNNTKVSTNKYAYKISENGTYKFLVYNQKNSYKEATITVNNINKTVPNGTCSGEYKNGISTVYINATDDIGINKYVINGATHTTSPITLNSEIKEAKVTIYDKAGNYTNIGCNLVNNNVTLTPSKPVSSGRISTPTPSPSSGSSYNKPTKPIDSGNIIYEASTNSLKYWVEKYNTYYVSHVWVEDAYNQLKTAVPTQFGSSLEKPSIILSSAITKHSFQNKAIIAVNGSGFVLQGTYDTAYASANSNWNMTSVSPIVIVEGKVLRDISSGKIPSNKHITYGLKRDGNLAYYTYEAGTNLQSNINTSKQIIRDGVKNTVAFNPVIVYNGRVQSSGTSANIRQGFCQIDKNNFIFITNKSSRDSGFSFKSLGEYMVSLGCKTGFNLDGGGSTSLLVKLKNQDVKVIYGNGRKIADILYFHEK